MKHELKRVPFSTLEGVMVGNARDDDAKTGVTVLYFPHTASAGVDISGGGPASRETPVLDPTRNNTPLNALVLAGGSAYGLEASTGVMECLEQHGIGYDTGYALVPIVVQSDIYDLSYGSASVRPNKAMGYLACSRALEGNDPRSGNVGAGTGATVGKILGMERAEKSGIGYSALQLGELVVGAVVVVNALGDIYQKGQKIAGLSNADSAAELFRTMQAPLPGTNTTIGAVITNAGFNNAQMQKVASMARNAFARCIRPVGTMLDGDTIYGISTSAHPVEADINVVGTMASDAMEAAIADAVLQSRDA